MGTYLHNRSLVILAFLLLLARDVSSQETKRIPHHPDRYKLDIPAEWLKRPKMVRTITGILPKALTEITDRDFCTVCNAGYKIELFIDSVRVYNEHTSSPIQMGRLTRYTYSFNYSFYAGLLLSDSNSRPLSILRLNAGDELMTYTKHFEAGPRNAVYRYENVYDTLGHVAYQRPVEEIPPVVTDLPKHNAEDVLTSGFLREICETRINEIERYLRRTQ